jgi:acetyl-CoA carboxylase carboxyltransferase component
MLRIFTLQRKLIQHQKMFNNSKIEMFNEKLKNCINEKVEDYERILKQMVDEDVSPNEDTFVTLKNISKVLENKQRELKKKSGSSTRRLSPEVLKKILEDKNLIEK